MNEGLLTIGASLIMIIAMGSLALAIGYLKCNIRWPDRTHEIQLFAGCLVEHEGFMVPEDRIWFN